MSWAPVSPSAPNTDMPPSADTRLRRIVIILPAALALAYALGHLGWYLATPLGRVPVLDERENLDLAGAIASGALPAAPFYRAPGYALLLACIRWAGVPAQALFPAALLLGAVLHAADAALAARIALRWFGVAAALAAGILFALNPVLIHFATQALDSTLSMTLFLAGLELVARARSSPGGAGPWAGAGALWAAATLVRPNYLFTWALLPPLALTTAGTARLRARLVAASLCGVLLFAAAAAWQWRVCGVPGFLPWQGAYNLWSANRPGANGRFYTQRVSLPPELARANPARAESVLLYEQETGGAPEDIPAMNAHWRSRFIDEVASHPLRLGALMEHKAYALLNNWEQYNNKTFAFHKERSPWLRWNPVCFGLLLVLGVAGAYRLAAQVPGAARTLAWVGAACAASVLLFFVSARFRLPLAAMLTVLAGGALGSPGFWRGLSRRAAAGVALSMVLAAAVAFSKLGGVQDASTFVQDHALLARAALTVGDDATALAEAREALKMQPWHPDAAAIEKAAQAELAERGRAP